MQIGFKLLAEAYGPHEIVRQAGFDRLALISAGPDVDAFFEFYERELAEPLRALG